MKKFLSLTVLLNFLISSAAFAASSEVNLQASSSWDGKPVIFGGQQLSAVSEVIKINPGESLPFHCHPVPSFAYVINGDLTIEKKGGEKQSFKKGDSFAEITNTWHRGVNKSKNETVEIVVFFIGAKDKNMITILDNKENKNKCSDQ